MSAVQFVIMNAVIVFIVVWLAIKFVIALAKRNNDKLVKKAPRAEPSAKVYDSPWRESLKRKGKLL